MSTLGKYAALVLEKTLEGKIPWKEIVATRTSYNASFEDLVVSIQYRTFENSAPSDYRFSIENKAGQEVEGYYQEQGDAEFVLLGDLYEAARRRALRIDETLNKLEKILKGL